MDKVMCYGAKMPEEVGYYAIAVDKPEHRKYLAKDIAGWIKEGAIIERIDIDTAKSGFQQYCNWKESQRQVKNENQNLEI